MIDTVLFIAIAHAVPVLLVSLLSDSRKALKTTALIMATFAVVAGNVAYALIDLVAIGFAYYVCAARMEARYGR